MKSIASLIFFLPVIIYIIFLVLNFGSLGISQEIRFPFLYSGPAPIVLIISFYFILYVVGLWFTFKFSNFFSNVQKGKMGTQINDLKAELYDKQSDLIASIKKDFETNLGAYKEESEKDRKLYKTETDKILNNLQFEITELSAKVAELKNEK